MMDRALPGKPGADPTMKTVDKTAARQELEAVLTSPEFEGAARLHSFLRYVVNEELEGRGSAIRAKTIGEDVYGITSNRGNDPLAAIRVDAGRLRRRLDTYYSRPQNFDTIRIHIDKGGYAPRFEMLQSDKATEQITRDPTKRPAGSGKAIRLALAAAACLAAVAAFGPYSSVSRQEAPAIGIGKTSKPSERNALFAASPLKLQSINLAADARDLMFPALDRKRLMAALTLFEQSIALDRDYYGGFAGAGQINALLASQMPPTRERDAFLTAARDRATRALELSPQTSWSQASMAMVHFAEKDCETAASYAARATNLDPNDLYALNFDAVIALFCGDFERAVSVAKPLIGTSALSERLAFHNTAATAEFHLGNYADSIDLYLSAVESGAPVGALTLAYLSAAHAKQGQTGEARRYVRLLLEAWPDFPLDVFLQAVFSQSEHANDVIDTLRVWIGMQS